MTAQNDTDAIIAPNDDARHASKMVKKKAARDKIMAASWAKKD